MATIDTTSSFNKRNINVGKVERWASVLGGAALAALALRKRSRRTLGIALAGAPLIWRGATGHCAVYERLGIDRNSSQTLDDTLDARPVTATDRQPIGQNL